MQTIAQLIESLQEIAKLPEKLEGIEKLWDIFGGLALTCKDVAISLRIEHNWDDKIEVIYRIEGDRESGLGNTLQEAWTEFCKKRSPPPPPKAEEAIKEVETLLGMPADAAKLPDKVVLGSATEEEES
jgi:hypothetical protein